MVFLAEKKYEDRGIVLDFLPQGHPSDPRPLHLKEPIVQVLGDTFFTLLEVIPLKGVTFNVLDEIFIGKGEREKIDRVKRRIAYEDLTSAAKTELPRAISLLVDKHPERFVDFFNKAGPITTRFHQLELIPGVGKKIMWTILQESEKAPFSDFKDLEKRVRGFNDPKQAVVKRIEMELRGEDKYSVFVRAPARR
ncbi:MAG: DUF655 domain-containing protein [Candidatus Hadarchaeales archaeon]